MGPGSGRASTKARKLPFPREPASKPLDCIAAHRFLMTWHVATPIMLGCALLQTSQAYVSSALLTDDRTSKRLKRDTARRVSERKAADGLLSIDARCVVHRFETRCIRGSHSFGNTVRTRRAGANARSLTEEPRR
jgi:hypothetical protein